MMIHYLDHHNVFRNGTLVMPLLKDGEQCVFAGTTVYALAKEDEDAHERELIQNMERKHGISFIYTDQSVEIPFYCVPLVEFFATDADGYFGTLGGNMDLDSGQIYYIGKNREVRFVPGTLRALLLEGAPLQKVTALPDTLQVFDSLEEAKSKLPFLHLDLPDSYFETD